MAVDGWSAVWLVGWIGRLFGWMYGCVVVGWLAGWMVGRLLGWLDVWLAWWLDGWVCVVCIVRGAEGLRARADAAVAGRGVMGVCSLHCVVGGVWIWQW